MEPIPAMLLNTLASGAAGQSGISSWWELTELVRQPFQRLGSTHVSTVSSCETELSALTRAPEDMQAAQLLSTALAVRAMVDTAFHARLQRWQNQTNLLGLTPGFVHNTISSGTIQGAAFQSGSIGNVTINSPQPPPAPTVEHIRQVAWERRQNVQDAAYSRFLGRMPQPNFEVVEWQRREPNGLFDFKAITYRAKKRSYFQHNIDPLLQKVREMAAHRKLEELSAYLASFRPDPCDSSIEYRVSVPGYLYSALSVDRYMQELRQSLSAYFTELGEL